MTDKIAIVTGGAGGIGQAVATRLARAGFGMFVLDKNEKAGKETAELLRQQNHAAEFYRVDLQHKTEVRDLFESIYAKTKRIDVLVNLAGGTLHKNPIQDFSLSDWREVIKRQSQRNISLLPGRSKADENAKGRDHHQYFVEFRNYR